jgi:hypothetical protein
MPTTGGAASDVIIYRSSTNSIPSNPLTKVSASGGQYVDNQVYYNQTYYYWIVSSNDYGVGPAVATGSVTLAAGVASSPSSGGGFLILIFALVSVIVVVFVFVRLRRRRKGF